MPKRVRTPSHYIAGLGDGKVRDEGNLRHRDDSHRRPRHHDLYQDDAHWDMYLKPREQSADPWQFSAFALLASVVLMSALFLHLISDTSEQKSKKRRHRPVRIDKKIDVWNDDEEEDHVAPKPDAPRPPQVYYHPYQPRLQQRVPQKLSMNPSNPAGAAIRSSQPTAAVANPAPPQQDVFNTGSYYMHPSGGAMYPTPASRPRLPSASPKQSPKPTRSEHASPIVARRILKPNAVTPARPLESRVSSFGSLTDAHQSEEDEERGTPKRLHESSHSSILLSPGTEDVEETYRLSARNSRRLVMPDLVEETPRAANGRRQMLQPPDNLDALQKPSSSMAFAAPPGQDNGISIPFVPSLGTHAIKPPLSVNLDELQLHHMESGNISHWEARVEEESQILQERIFSGSHEDIKIPSGDPRCHIDHKRPNITHDTNSAKALQGAIDFNKLELIEVVGGGGFGQVWKAKLRGTPVAVKVLTGSAQARNVPKAVLEEFAAEINLLKGMQHPNICLYMGACVDPPNRAIVTELAANGSLWDALRLPLKEPFVPCDGITQNGWPESLYQPDVRHGAPPASVPVRYSILPPKYTWQWVLVKKVALGMARGMAYLHGGDPPVLHRDLKSANILLDESYNPKVCDFGLSRLKAQERSMTGNCGTVQWMAPEVLANQAYNEHADIFSYGIICWELLSRHCPYDGMTAIQCALAVLNRDQRPEIPKWCPPALHALIRSCLKKNPDERPSFEELILALDSMPDI